MTPRRTEQTCVQWIVCYVLAHNKRRFKEIELPRTRSMLNSSGECHIVTAFINLSAARRDRPKWSLMGRFSDILVDRLD
jgi:hypothetical protein